MASALSLRPNVARGAVEVVGVGIPNGQVLITRTAGRVPEEIRNGDFHSITGGFVRNDAEVPFGSELTYTVTDEVDSRFIQSNRVPNPRAGIDLTGWTAGSGRTMARETATAMVPPRDAATSVQIGPNTAGVSAGTVAARTLASVAPSGLTVGSWYFSGQMYYDSPDLWLWQDVKTAGTWQTIRNLGTWQTVKSKSSEQANQPFATLWAMVVDGSGNQVVAPFQVLGALAAAGNQWLTFQATVTVPAGAPAGCRLVFLHGPLVREYACTFWLTTLMVCPSAERASAGSLMYFDGDSALPADPGENLAPGYGWHDLSHDASMAWAGVPGNSTSIFTGPSQIQASTKITFGVPDRSVAPSEPVMLTDPVAPQLSMWFTLLGIGDLTYPGRVNSFDVLGDRFRSTTSQVRGKETGQLQLLTYTLDQATMAEQIFGTGRILLLRNPNPAYPENGWFISIAGDATAARLGRDQRRPERIWTVPFTRVRRPAGLIEAATSVTWSTLRTRTWEQVRAERENWLDVALTPPGAA